MPSFTLLRLTLPYLALPSMYLYISTYTYIPIFLCTCIPINIPMAPALADRSDGLHTLRPRTPEIDHPTNPRDNAPKGAPARPQTTPQTPGTKLQKGRHKPQGQSSKRGAGGGDGYWGGGCGWSGRAGPATETDARKRPPFQTRPGKNTPFGKPLTPINV